MLVSKSITSFSNPEVRNVIAHREKRVRDKMGLILVEGEREIRLALESKLCPKELFVCLELLKTRDIQKLMERKEFSDTHNFDVSRPVFEKIAFGDRAEGVIALFKKPDWTMGDISLPKNPLIVIIENVEKPGNLGAILRTCDGAGVDAVLVCDSQTDTFNPNVIRSSLGTIFTLKPRETTNEKALQFLKDKGITVCAALPDAATGYTHVNFNTPLAIVLGSEQKGLSRFWIEHSQVKMKIPMKGQADSLNVSATAAILIFEALRQRS